MNSVCHRLLWAQQIHLRGRSFFCPQFSTICKVICFDFPSTVPQSSTMLSRPLSFRLQASSSSWLAKICRSSSFSRHAIDTGVVLGQSALSDRSSGSNSWKVQTMKMHDYCNLWFEMMNLLSFAATYKTLQSTLFLPPCSKRDIRCPRITD